MAAARTGGGGAPNASAAATTADSWLRGWGRASEDTTCVLNRLEFKILERVGEVACRLELPVQLVDVHDVFHISQLKKGFGPHDKEPLPLDDLNVKEDLTIVEHPIRILETMTRVTRNRVIKMCKV
jgi:hypothetical protein